MRNIKNSLYEDIMEAEDSFLIDMPLARRREPKWCDYSDCCCIIIVSIIITVVVAIIIAIFVFGFKPYTIK